MRPGNPLMRQIIHGHHRAVTYGENIGTSTSEIPPLPRLRARTRQPVLMDLWEGGVPEVFTTVANWAQTGRDVECRGETYRWSKHHEWLKFLEVSGLAGRPDRAWRPTSSSPRPSDGPNEIVRAGGLGHDARAALPQKGWRLTSGVDVSLDFWRYRD